MCLMLDQVFDLGHETYILGDTNIDWNLSNCPLKDHIFTNCSYLCSKTLSVPVGCNDHNFVVTVRKAKVPKSGPKIVYSRLMKTFNE